MVYRSRPITKFCCSDTPETEVRIIALFSIISTCFCLFLIFLSFANLVGQRETYQRSLQGNSSRNYTLCNESKLGGRDINPNCTNDLISQHQPTTSSPTTPKSKITTPKSKKKSKKEPSMSTLDWICRLLLWERNVETFWILLPCLWNLCDVLRGLLLLHASTTKQSWLLRLWYALTCLNIGGGIVIFYPIFTNYTAAGDLIATFILIYLLLIFYNCYSLWIVHVFIQEIKIGGISGQTIHWSSSGHDPEVGEDTKSLDHVQRY